MKTYVYLGLLAAVSCVSWCALPVALAGMWYFDIRYIEVITLWWACLEMQPAYDYLYILTGLDLGATA